jgi:dihydrodipicolinate synthase/N-acetylneuraminate lyase
MDSSETFAMAMGKQILKWRGIIEHETVRKPLGPLQKWQKDHLKAMAQHSGII